MGTIEGQIIKMKSLIDILHKKECSLVLKDVHGNVRIFHQKGVRDLEYMLDYEPSTLHGATVADKVIGKAAAGMMAYGGVASVYADIMSARAIPILKGNKINYSYAKMVDHIIIPKNDSRCPLETIVASAITAEEIVSTLRKHFSEMNTQ